MGIRAGAVIEAIVAGGAQDEPTTMLQTRTTQVRAVIYSRPSRQVRRRQESTT